MKLGSERSLSKYCAGFGWQSSVYFIDRAISLNDVGNYFIRSVYWPSTMIGSETEN